MATRVIHLLPVRGSWQMVEDGDVSSQTFTTLGLALDAATVSPEPIRVIVHEQRIAS